MSAALLALALSLGGPDSGWVAGPDGVRGRALRPGRLLVSRIHGSALRDGPPRPRRAGGTAGAGAAKFGTEYPASLLHTDSVAVVDPAIAARMDSLRRSGWAREHPREFCEAIDTFVAGQWPERAEKITSLERGPPP
jgi:hypothetical protein